MYGSAPGGYGEEHPICAAGGEAVGGKENRAHDSAGFEGEGVREPLLRREPKEGKQVLGGAEGAEEVGRQGAGQHVKHAQHAHETAMRQAEHEVLAASALVRVTHLNSDDFPVPALLITPI